MEAFQLDELRVKFMKLIKFLRDVIIAPHGVTDVSHSIQTNNQLNLLKALTLVILKETWKSI